MIFIFISTGLYVCLRSCRLKFFLLICPFASVFVLVKTRTECDKIELQLLKKFDYAFNFQNNEPYRAPSKVVCDSTGLSLLESANQKRDREDRKGLPDELVKQFDRLSLDEKRHAYSYFGRHLSYNEEEKKYYPVSASCSYPFA